MRCDWSVWCTAVRKSMLVSSTGYEWSALIPMVMSCSMQDLSQPPVFFTVRHHTRQHLKTLVLSSVERQYTWCPKTSKRVEKESTGRLSCWRSLEFCLYKITGTENAVSNCWQHGIKSSLIAFSCCSIMKYGNISWRHTRFNHYFWNTVYSL